MTRLVLHPGVMGGADRPRGLTRLYGAAVSKPVSADGCDTSSDAESTSGSESGSGSGNEGSSGYEDKRRDTSRTSSTEGVAKASTVQAGMGVGAKDRERDVAAWKAWFAADALLDLGCLATFWALHGLLSAALFAAWLWHEISVQWESLVKGEVVLGGVRTAAARAKTEEKELQRLPRHCVLALPLPPQVEAQAQPQEAKIAVQAHLASCVGVLRHCVLLGIPRVTLFEESGSATDALDALARMLVTALSYEDEDGGKVTWRCDRVEGTSLLELRAVMGSCNADAPTCTIHVLGGSDGQEAIAAAARDMAVEEKRLKSERRQQRQGRRRRRPQQLGTGAVLMEKKYTQEDGQGGDGDSGERTAIGDGSGLLERVAAHKHLGDADVLLYAETDQQDHRRPPLAWTRAPALLLRCPELISLRCSAAAAAADARRVLQALRVFERTVQRNGKCPGSQYCNVTNRRHV